MLNTYTAEEQVTEWFVIIKMDLAWIYVPFIVKIYTIAQCVEIN